MRPATQLFLGSFVCAAFFCAAFSAQCAYIHSVLPRLPPVAPPRPGSAPSESVRSHFVGLHHRRTASGVMLRPVLDSGWKWWRWVAAVVVGGGWWWLVVVGPSRMFTARAPSCALFGILSSIC